MMKIKRIALLLFLLLFLSSCTAAQEEKEAILLPASAEESEDDTLVLGTGQFLGVFNPFFVSDANDRKVINLTCATLYAGNEDGTPASLLAEYTPPNPVYNSDGELLYVLYRIKLAHGACFSDGTPITIDDVIFSMKVLCDPSYDGFSAFGSLPIAGIDSYRYDDPNYHETVQALRQEAEEPEEDTVEDYLMQQARKQLADRREEMLQEYEEEIDIEMSDEEQDEAVLAAFCTQQMEKNAAHWQKLAEEAAFAEALLAHQTREKETIMEEVPGIVRCGDDTLYLILEEYDPKAIYTIGSIIVSPRAYYAENGFVKGDLQAIREKSAKPMGAGAYCFSSYHHNVVTLTANPLYLRGKPKTETIKLQVLGNAGALEALLQGEVDIAEPAATPEVLDLVEEAGLHTRLVDTAGYGYLGINTERVPDLSVRKGIMHLINRTPAVKAYYGDLAEVIERSMSTVSWAYPVGAQAVYEFSPEKALDYFREAGYAQTKKNKKTVLEKDGRQLVLTIGIAGDGVMDHPCSAVLTQMKLSLEEMGGKLEIVDCDSSILYDRIRAGKWDLWISSQRSTPDPDLYPFYHSRGAQNYVRLKSDELDALLEQARNENNLLQRKYLYGEALDLLMEYAVEMPIYQRKTLTVFDPERVDITSLPQKMNGFYSYLSAIEKLQMIS